MTNLMLLAQQTSPIPVGSSAVLGIAINKLIK